MVTSIGPDDAEDNVGVAVIEMADTSDKSSNSDYDNDNYDKGADEAHETITTTSTTTTATTTTTTGTVTTTDEVTCDVIVNETDTKLLEVRIRRLTEPTVLSSLS